MIWAGRGLWVPDPTSCPKQGQLWAQTRLLRGLSFWVLTVHKDGDCTASGQPAPSPNCPAWRSFMSCPIWTSLVSIHVCCLSASSCVPPLRAWLNFFDSTLPVGMGKLPKAASSPGWTSPAPSAPPHRAGAPGPSCLSSPLLNLWQFVHYFLIMGAPKWMWHSRFDLRSPEQSGWSPPTGSSHDPADAARRLSAIFVSRALPACAQRAAHQGPGPFLGAAPQAGGLQPLCWQGLCLPRAGLHHWTSLISWSSWWPLPPGCL